MERPCLSDLLTLINCHNSIILKLTTDMKKKVMLASKLFRLTKESMD